jgi:hypothetical protein
MLFTLSCGARTHVCRVATLGDAWGPQLAQRVYRHECRHGVHSCVRHRCAKN